MVETAQERTSVLTEVRTAVRHGIVYGLGSVLAKAIGFLMLPFYTRYLSPADYGVLEILDLGMSLIGMVLHMGVAPALLRAYGTAQTADEKRQAVSTAFIFVSATGLVTLGIGLAFISDASAMLFGPELPARYLLISFTAFIFSYITSLPRTYLRALEASGTFTSVETVSLVVMLGLNIYFIAFLKIGLVGILLSSLIVGTIQMVVLCAWMLRRVGITFHSRHMRRMASFGLPLVLSNLAVFTLNFSDRFFLQHMQSLEAVGIYSVGYKFAFMINYLLVQPFYVMWQTRMYAIHANPQYRAIFSHMFALYSMLLLYAALALSALSPEIVTVMVGSRFAATDDVIPIVAFAYVFYGVGYYVQVGMFLGGKTGWIGGVSAVTAVLNIVLNYVLIFNYGLLGAAWATIISFVAFAAGNFCLSQRVFPLPLGIGRFGVGMTMGIGVYFICRWAAPASFAAALLMKLLVLAAFPVLLWK
jgi:O-antigen/teichoic acid export membrane protein